MSICSSCLLYFFEIYFIFWNVQRVIVYLTLFNCVFLCKRRVAFRVRQLFFLVGCYKYNAGFIPQRFLWFGSLILQCKHPVSVELLLKPLRRPE